VIQFAKLLRKIVTTGTGTWVHFSV